MRKVHKHYGSYASLNGEWVSVSLCSLTGIRTIKRWPGVNCAKCLAKKPKGKRK